MMKLFFHARLFGHMLFIKHLGFGLASLAVTFNTAAIPAANLIASPVNLVASTVNTSTNTVSPAVVVADPVNLIANPLVETVNPANSALPLDWQTGNWGTNTSTFSYLNTGSTGDNNSLAIQTTAYTNGASEWYFNPVNVQAGFPIYL